MYLTEKEIFNQYEALDKTYQYFLEKTEEISNFINKINYNSITFIGCGSSYCLAQSGEISTKVQLGIPANSIPAGDLMINFPFYRNILKDTLLVVNSRSGSTSEVLAAVKKARKEFNTPCILISARTDSELGNIVDLNIELPWAFDESVCQTRTVTNFYTSNLLLLAIINNDDSILNEIKIAINNGEEYINEYTTLLEKIAKNNTWNKVVLLADSELGGIANEAAIAFKEIPQLPSNYYHVLDLRHGPMVLIDDETLVIMAVAPFESSYQRELIKDMKNKGAKVISFGGKEEIGADYHIKVSDYENYSVKGIPFIFISQVIAYYKALERGINPDKPLGLDPWIEL